MSSCSTSTVHQSYQYDVFLSFRGEDTRKNFVDHLYEALQRQAIRTYIDDRRIEKGNRIKDQLLKSIQESKFFIIVFSKNYASSSWCLDELVKIMECQRTKEQIAYPVFYDVDPSEIRNQSGLVAKAFAKHNKKEFGEWKEALKEAGSLAGWDLRNTADGHEAKVIRLIVEQISLESRSIHSSVDENLVGVEHRMHDLESSLNIGLSDVRMIGIKGIGGGGKTTLARAIFDRLSIQFTAKSFVENVREVSKACGLLSLQKQVLSNLLIVLDEKDSTLSSVHDGINRMKMRLHHEKVLLVLDDVDHIGQLEALAGGLNWFKPGSRVIITTRDEQVLMSHKVKWIHDVSLLSNAEAICLFSRYAFGRDLPIQGYKELSLEVVRYAAGLPLTIKVLGSFLCAKDKLEWVDALERLKTIPLKETLEKLELSYNSLENDYREILLDVACILKGQRKDDAINILESCGFHARNGLRVLQQKSLLTISDDAMEEIGMHDHIEEMCMNIVRRERPDEPNTHSRLWICEEIEDILANGLGTVATRCIKVSGLGLSPDIVLKGLGNMEKLRVFIVESETYNFQGYVNIDQTIQYFPNALRVLSWRGYPNSSLSKTCPPNNRYSLEMCDGSIKQLWEGGERKVLNKLRFLNLGHSQLSTLDLELFPYLERLNLRVCYHLVELHVPDGRLNRLVYLNLSFCNRLESLLFLKQLGSLEVLNLAGLHFSEFPSQIFGHPNNSLLHLDLSFNDIEELPSTIGNLQKLVFLDLSFCKKLTSLPASICSLQQLTNLVLYRCAIENLPENLGYLEVLEMLNLSRTHVKHLPDSISMLKSLKTLLLKNCRVLEKLPEDLGRLESLEELDLSYCNIRDIPSSVGMLKHLRTLKLEHCDRLEKLPEEMGDLESLEVTLEDSTATDRSWPKFLEIIGNESKDGSVFTATSKTRKNTNNQMEPCSMGDSEKLQILEGPIYEEQLEKAAYHTMKLGIQSVKDSLETHLTEDIDANGYLLYNEDSEYESAGQNEVDDNLGGVEGEAKDDTILGRVFNTPDDAYMFYNRYAFAHGFGIRIHWDYENTTTNEVYRKMYVCNKQGLKKLKGDSTTGDSKKRKRDSRTGCKAKLRISKTNDKWRVDIFDVRHNHDLSKTPTKVMKNRFDGKYHPSTASKSMMVNVGKSGLRRNKAEVTSMQCADILSKQRKHYRGKELDGLIKHFQDKATIDINQYFVVDSFDDGSPRNVFWVDGRSRDAYIKFRDVLVFDVTYMPNKFKFSFAPFIGVNHHGQPIIIGCALLENEKEETFQWLFEHFLKCMFDKYPTTITTDKNKAVCNAIYKVFPNSRHRYCVWHIYNHELEHLRPFIARYDDFQKSYREWVNSDTVEEFETQWEVIRGKYNLERSSWMIEMYEQRTYWVKAFFKDVFLAGMTTSERSESIHAYFDGFVNVKTMLNKFVIQYNKAVSSRRAMEEDEDFKTMNSRPTFLSIHPIEAKAGKCYTREIFYLFQREWIEATNNLTHETLSKSLDLISYAVGEVDVEKIFWRIVNFRFSNMVDVTCSCANFETYGILCKHVLYVMKKKHVETLPDHYILPRWRLDTRCKAGNSSIRIEE